MKLQTLFLEHFRNYTSKEFSFEDSINIIVGQNGIGKTNILEALFTLHTTRPFRNGEKEVFLEYDSEFGRVHALLSSQEILEIFWQKTPKRTLFKRNDIPLSAKEYLLKKNFFSVLFSPEDLHLPFSSPQNRRNFLSKILSPLFGEYFDAGLKYNLVLKNRAKLLKSYKEGKAKRTEFEFWNMELEKHHIPLQRYRRDFFDFANTYIQDEYQKISGKNESLFLEFLPSVDHTKSLFLELERMFQKDILLGRTEIGSHRDDFKIILRGKPLEETASRGEVRSAILAFKFIEREYIKKQTGKIPLFLLDDVFSELDESHRQHLFDALKTSQVIISTTDFDAHHKHFIGANVIELSS